jgi:hypothetical protein
LITKNLILASEYRARASLFILDGSTALEISTFSRFSVALFFGELLKIPKIALVCSAKKKNIQEIKHGMK